MLKKEDLIFTTIKVVIIGDCGVGKSSLMLRYTNGKFEDDEKSTIGVDFRMKTLYIDGFNIKLAMWDTAGHERFRSLTPNYYRDADGAILVYDVTRRHTFENIKTWFNELKYYGTKENMVSMVVGNKVDRAEREVSLEEGQSFAKEYGMLFAETSAKANVGIAQVFEEIVKRIMCTEDLLKLSPKRTDVPANPNDASEFVCFKC